MRVAPVDRTFGVQVGSDVFVQHHVLELGH